MPKPKTDKPPKKDPVIINDVVPSSCKKCQSTKRSDYRGVTSQEISGIRDGKPYNLVVWRYCTCLNCGQVRCDRTFENAVDGETPSPENEVRA